ncbi:ABC transporter six-transmembrane domain-containing protein [Pseudomonas sp. TH05]|uniref:ABC transporter six-transmembrane domain-containing protein n=1 Tax=unclassified Pseudomonas TaxID=196821 RepID=UPI00191245AB|nr:MULTISPECIES: ABC transporter six-transmembrane domain-containing protein [unclassified Pseudomonas]MBK5537913.1 ABC transporter six-transmembrane domain-containing protein [Pseudomonas sp. TH07]MBK5555979.1 ABC transporter six-transmembrane domain-containing protein [Pseudomonas sp. TH05]
MSAVTSQILVDESKKIGQQSAGQTLKAIARAYPGKLFFTLSLVALENALLLAYPLFAGFAVDSIIRGDTGSALVYAVVVLAFWMVGAARRAVDTRTFTRIYTDLAVPVILNQRLLNQDTSTAAARVVLAREFVDFFEKHIPTIATALVSIVGAAAMLALIEPWIGLACLLALILCCALLPRFARRNQALHERLNDRLEKEIGMVARVGAASLQRHYRVLSRLRIRLSDREAVAYLFIGTVAAALFVVAISQLALSPAVKAGHVYAVMTYLWTFVSSLDEAPTMVDQLARLRDIGKRVDPGL